jgi:hypothetical protein
MGHVVYLTPKNSPGIRAQADQDLRDASGVATEAAYQLLSLARSLEANIDLVDRIVDQIEDPIAREASRRQNEEDREALKASVDELCRKTGKLWLLFGTGKLVGARGHYERRDE